MGPGSIVCLLIVVKDWLLIFGIRLAIHFSALSQQSEKRLHAHGLVFQARLKFACVWVGTLGLMLEWVGLWGEPCQQMDPSQTLKDVHSGIWQRWKHASVQQEV